MTRMTPMDKGSILGTNPYNKQKTWDDENKTGEPFVSADDSMAYVSTPKTVVMDKMEDKLVEATVEDTPAQEAPAEDKYSKVDYKKRYDNLKTHYDKQVNKFKSEEKDLRKQLADHTPKYVAPTSPEELAKFKGENPDLYNFIETVSHVQTNSELTELRDSLKEVQETLAVTEAEKSYMELEKLVPDFKEIRMSEEFHQWAEKQPQEIQNWIYKNRTDVQLAAQAIKLYKASVGAPANKEQRPEFISPNRAAEHVPANSRREEPSSGEKIWTGAEIGSLSVQQYESQRTEIDLAFAEGRVRP